MTEKRFTLTLSLEGSLTLISADINHGSKDIFIVSRCCDPWSVWREMVANKQTAFLVMMNIACNTGSHEENCVQLDLFCCFVEIKSTT